MGRITTALITGLLTLTGCTSTADPTEPPPPLTATTTATASTPTTTTTATTTATAAPTPPAMPDAAKAHTKAGAKAFVKHFWDVVSYATNTGDTDSIRALSVPGCKGCDGGIAAIDRIYSAGGTIRGGSPTLSRFNTELLYAGSVALAHVTVTASFTSERIDMNGTAHDSTRRPKDARDRLELMADGRSWKVAQLVVLP